MSARCTVSASLSSPAPAAAGGLRARLAAGLAWIRRAWRVAEERRQLATLDDRQMADLGLTEAVRQAEARRPFWDID